MTPTTSKRSLPRIRPWAVVELWDLYAPGASTTATAFRPPTILAGPAMNNRAVPRVQVVRRGRMCEQSGLTRGRHHHDSNVLANPELRAAGGGSGGQRHDDRSGRRQQVHH